MNGLARQGQASRAVSHLLLAGHNPVSPPLAYSSPTARQSPSNPSLTAVPFGHWLGAVGRARDVEAGWRLCGSGIGPGHGHALVAYRNGLGDERVFAAGRNEAGQLGIGYASQEDTRGLVEGFRGESILQVESSSQSSYLLLRRDGTFTVILRARSISRLAPDSRAVYGFGNLSRGRLGQPAFWPPPDLAEHEEPRMHMLARATQVPLPPELGHVKEMATGFDHLLLLSETGEIWGTGCNTDGQLGLGEGVLTDMSQMTQTVLPNEIATDGGATSIRAGADTSALLTAGGRLWTWGNSEYAQALQGHKIDQIHVPTLIDDSFLPSARKIVDFRCGGSFSLVLDDAGSVWSAGFGALGLGKDTMSTETPRRIPSLEGVSRIRAGWGYAAAIQDDGKDSRLFTWGLNNVHGRLGLGALSHRRQGASEPGQMAVQMHVYEPTEVGLPLRELGLSRDAGEWTIGQLELGEQAMWVGLEEGSD